MSLINLDLVVSAASGATIASVWRNAAGSFSLFADLFAGDPTPPTFSAATTAGDIAGDGDVDIFIADAANGMLILRNDVR